MTYHIAGVPATASHAVPTAAVAVGAIGSAAPVEKSWAAVTSGGSAADTRPASSAENTSEDAGHGVHISLQPAPPAPAAAEIEAVEMAGIASPSLSAAPLSPQNSPMANGQVLSPRLDRAMSPEGDVWCVPAASANDCKYLFQIRRAIVLF